MSRRTIVTVDRDTGEIVEGAAVLVPPKRRNGFMNGWTAVSSPELLNLAARKLTGSDYRVLLALLSVAGFGNVVRLSQSDVARLAGLSRQQVSESVAVLVERHLVDWIEEERPQPLVAERLLMLSPLLSWRGKAQGHRAAIAQWVQAHPDVVLGDRSS